MAISSRYWAILALLQLNLAICYQIDPATSADAAQTTRRFDGKLLDLVMSDEFNEDGRSFEPGQDEMFEAIQKPDEANEALQFCT
jgi:Beta-glucan synthesis-associated protein SKN1/KRE6/Sbg1